VAVAAVDLTRECAKEEKTARATRDTLRPMLKQLTALIPALLCASFVAAAQPAFAQGPMAVMRRGLGALRAGVEELRGGVEAVKGGAPAQPAATVEMLQTQVAELAQTKVESSTRLPLKIFGTVHAGVFANSANANWLDNPNLVGAPPADGHNGTMSASLRQT